MTEMMRRGRKAILAYLSASMRQTIDPQRGWGHWANEVANYRRHFVDTIAESSAQMLGDFEVTSSAIWCPARILRAKR
jgi:hypothetical protein